MKHLPKHLQPRWRYLAVELECWPDADVDRGTFQRHLWYAAQNLLGDAESATLDLSVLRSCVRDGARSRGPGLHWPVSTRCLARNWVCGFVAWVGPCVAVRKSI